MKVLISAIACHPEHGSESSAGWKAALAIAQAHDVRVLTHSDNMRGIENYVKDNGLKNPRFTYFGSGGPYHPNRLVARGQSWLRYLSWTRQLLSQARELLERERFDLVHHVTYSTYRVASPLWQLGVPFVLGPVGGGEKLPWIAAGSMSRGQRIQECVRLLADNLAGFSGNIRQMVTNSSMLIASNQATARTLRSFGGSKREIAILPVVFFTDRQIQEIRAKQKVYPVNEHRLTVFSSGILEGRKGLSIALHAIRKATDAGLQINFTIPSRGPEFAYLKDLTHRLGLREVVKFPDSLPREEYWSRLIASDIYMAPSLRDNCPATLLEAMLSRCVPIVANCNGPGEIVTQEIGEVIEPDYWEHMATNIAGRLLRLASDRAQLRQKAEAASAYVARSYTQERYLSVIETVYNAAVLHH